jgi:predicted RNase H-like HicB family nuclease
MTNEILFPGVEITHENEIWVATYENCAAQGHTREQVIADLYDLIDSVYKRKQHLEPTKIPE